MIFKHGDKIQVDDQSGIYIGPTPDGKHAVWLNSQQLVHASELCLRPMPTYSVSLRSFKVSDTEHMTKQERQAVCAWLDSRMTPAEEQAIKAFEAANKRRYEKNKMPMQLNAKWLKENAHKYAGQCVALKSGVLFAHALNRTDLARMLVDQNFDELVTVCL